MSSSTRRQQEHSSSTQQQQDQQQQQQYQATIRSIDETKNNIQQAIDEVRRETPRYSQAVADFQTQTVDATQEIAHTFLDTQKEVINSFQSAWTPVVQRTTNNIVATPFFFSPGQIADIYARTVGAITEAYVASTRMATNMMFAGLEATRATTNYTRQNAKEASRITSNTARAFAQTAKETVQVQGEDEQRIGGGISVGGSSGSGGAGGAAGSAAGSFESGGAATTTTTRTTYTSEGTTAASGTGTGSTTTTTGTASLSDTVPGVTEKTRKK